MLLGMGQGLQCHNPDQDGRWLAHLGISWRNQEGAKQGLSSFKCQWKSKFQTPAFPVHNFPITAVSAWGSAGVTPTVTHYITADPPHFTSVVSGRSIQLEVFKVAHPYPESKERFKAFTVKILSKLIYKYLCNSQIVASNSTFFVLWKVLCNFTNFST